MIPALFMSGLLTATIVTVSHISEDLFFDGPHKVNLILNQILNSKNL